VLSRQAASSAPAAEDKSGAGKWILQDSCAGPCESVVAYAPVDATVLRRVIDGHDSGEVALLPCGFAVAPDGMDSKPAVITSSKVDGAAGSLVTVAFQVLATSASSATDGTLSADAVATVTGLVASTLSNIKKALRCKDC
jgi:homeobox-leucine zipper protein